MKITCKKKSLQFKYMDHENNESAVSHLPLNNSRLKTYFNNITES